MDPLLRSTLIKVLLPVAAILIVLTVAKARRLSLRDDVGLIRPGTKPLVVWIVVWLVWVAFSELLIRQFALEQAKAWPAYQPLIISLRVIAIGILGPFAEELVMRGAVLGRLLRRVGNEHAAIFIVAILWAAMHYMYAPATIILIAADGVLLGYARVRGGSLWIPIAMHTLGNLISIGQSLTA